MEGKERDNYSSRWRILKLDPGKSMILLPNKNNWSKFVLVARPRLDAGWVESLQGFALEPTGKLDYLYCVLEGTHFGLSRALKIGTNNWHRRFRNVTFSKKLKLQKNQLKYSNTQLMAISHKLLNNIANWIQKLRFCE